MPLLFSLPKHRSYLRPQTRLRSVFAHGGYHNDLAVAILVCASYQQHLPGCSTFSLKLVLAANGSNFWLLAFIKNIKSIFHAPPIVRVTVACVATLTYRQVQSFHKTSRSTGYANRYVLRGGKGVV